MTMDTAAAVLLCLVVCFHLGGALRCYQCNSHYQSECGYKEQRLSKDFLVDCDANATFCRKIDQLVEFEENGMGPDSRVIRECGHDQGNEKPYYFASGYGGLQYVYGCDKDECNAAAPLLPPATYTSLLLTALYYYYY